MGVSLNEVKAFCTVDHNLDDSLLTSLMTAADEYLIGAVGNCPDEILHSERANLIRLLLVRDMYDDRRYHVEGAGNATRAAVSSMLMQLRAEALPKEATG